MTEGSPDIVTVRDALRLFDQSFPPPYNDLLAHDAGFPVHNARKAILALTGAKFSSAELDDLIDRTTDIDRHAVLTPTERDTVLATIAGLTEQYGTTIALIRSRHEGLPN